MGMGDRADRSVQKTNEALAERERKLLSETVVDWESMKPKLGSAEDYDRLMAAVAEATAKNESIGQLYERLESLGSEGFALAKKVRGLIPV